MAFSASRIVLGSLILAAGSALLLSQSGMGQQGASVPRPTAKLYNTAKQKLLDGKTIYAYTVNTLNPELYCDAAKHYDFVWLEMQHSTMTWADLEKMIASCPGVGVPMIRLPDEYESTIQHATDIGAIGMIEPTVDTVEKAQAVVRYAKYPPEGRRSMGRNQATQVWGAFGPYRQTINDNMLVAVMIETPVGVANAYEIARTPGVDVVIAANTDLGNFSGYSHDSPEYIDMFKKIHDATIKAGKFFGCTSYDFAKAQPNSADYRFIQGGPSTDGWQPPKQGGRGKSSTTTSSR
jgi:2-keto-3-deoxy-L-rhamnonate aldolase RhmA